MIAAYSNVATVKKNATKYLGKAFPVLPSTRKDKKFMVMNPAGKWVHFGQMGYEDYTKHRDKARRANYLARARGIRGKWADNKFSPNNLSIHILW
jgi:hypothetical protein